MNQVILENAYNSLLNSQGNGFLISMDELSKLLDPDGKKSKRFPRDWLLEKKIKQFGKGGYYCRALVYDAILKEVEKCISGKEDNSGMSLASCVWATKRSKSKNTARDLLKKQMQESMQTA